MVNHFSLVRLRSEYIFLHLFNLSANGTQSYLYHLKRSQIARTWPKWYKQVLKKTMTLSVMWCYMDDSKGQSIRQRRKSHSRGSIEWRKFHRYRHIHATATSSSKSEASLHDNCQFERPSVLWSLGCIA